MKLHRIIAFCLVAAILCTMAPAVLPMAAQAATVTASGTCGDDLTWTLDDSGTLTISGTGAMDYGDGYAPWYSYRDSIKTVIIESGVISIGGYAFYNCIDLTSVTIPNGLISIEHNAFYGCSSLTSIAIPASVTNIVVTYPNGVAFRNCSNLTGIWVDENNPAYYSDKKGVLYSKDKTCLFQAPAKLSGEYVIQDGVISIGECAFAGCSGMTDVTIPDGVTSVGPSAFSNCSGLTSLVLPDSVTNLGPSAFSDCTGLTSVTIPVSVTYITDGVFLGCSGITDVYYKGSQEQWDAVAGNYYLQDATLHLGAIYVQADLQAGLDEAEDGATVVLTQDVILTSVAVWEGVTLNLNGYTLTVNYFTCYGAVADSGDGGNALIKVNKNIHIAEGNSFLPIYDSADGGYRFYKYQLQNLGYKTVEDDPNTLKAGIRLVLNNTAGYDVLSGTTDAAMDAMAYISWGNMPGAICYQFSDDTLRSYAAQAAADIAANGTTSKAITLTIRGIDKLGADASISVQPAMTTAPGVSAQGQTANWTAQ